MHKTTWGFLLCVLLLGNGPALGVPLQPNDDATIVLPAPKAAEGGSPVGLVFIIGAQLKPDQYESLVKKVQIEASNYSLAISAVIPSFPLNMPDPIQMASKVKDARSRLLQTGLPLSAPLVMAGHSLGAAVLQGFVAKHHADYGISAAVLTGAGLSRTYRQDSTGAVNFPVPVLSLSGSMDGLYRVVRQAEAYYHQVQTPNPAARGRFPVVIYDGVAHMSFATGTPPSTVKSHDLKPAIPQATAMAAAGITFAAFVASVVGDNPSALAQLETDVANAAAQAKPFIEALSLEGFVHLSPPCDSDLAMPSRCPHYARFPGGDTKKSGPNPDNCQCGTPWVQTVAVPTVAGLQDKEVSVTDLDAIQPVSDIAPVHLPHIWNSPCAAPGPDCFLNVTSVTEAVYSVLDKEDTGFSLISAEELRVKMVSRQTLWAAAGVQSPDFNTTDGGNLCRSINEQALEYALSVATPDAKARYASIGQNMTFGDDLGPYNAGPLWIHASLKVHEASDGSMLVQSPMMKTPSNFAIKAAAGFHYCKLLGPGRALEWVYIDGLRKHGGL